MVGYDARSEQSKPNGRKTSSLSTAYQIEEIKKSEHAQANLTWCPVTKESRTGP